jgi:D-alanyl-D-alanine carboxypeptidase
MSVRRYCLPIAMMVTLVLPVQLLAAGPSVAAVSDAQLRQTLRQNLADYLRTRSAIEHISTLSMSVSFRGGAQPINLAAGTTAYGGGQAVTPANLFQIGSNTKAFTAVLLLQLEAKGILSIDDTVGKWLPQYPAWSAVTIRQLLHMTSGIPTYDESAAFESSYARNPRVEQTPEQLVAYVYPSKNANPGFEYSNTNYILAQMIVDAASPLHGYQAELNDLIRKTGVPDTYYQPYFYPSSVMRRLVKGYYVNTDDKGPLSALLNTETSAYSLGWTQGAGGMVSTPAALTAWVRALFEGSVLPAKQLAELQSLVAIPSGTPIASTSAAQHEGFALGVFQITTPTLGLFWGYQGSTIGYRASYAYFPANGAIISVFTNSQAPAVASTVNTVLFDTIYKTLEAAGRI